MDPLKERKHAEMEIQKKITDYYRSDLMTLAFINLAISVDLYVMPLLSLLI